ncbi:hypothetical protein LTR85_003720 [Meristemomyces frigidus]|nr:hypothetical protein LTR85_003720 [Meristemomyces frigidus]
MRRALEAVSFVSPTAVRQQTLPSGRSFVPVAPPVPHPNSAAFSRQVFLFDEDQSLDTTATANPYARYIRLPPLTHTDQRQIDMTNVISVDEAAAAEDALHRHYQQRWGREMFPITPRRGMQRESALAHPMSAWIYSQVLTYLSDVQVEIRSVELCDLGPHLLDQMNDSNALDTTTAAGLRLGRSMLDFARDMVQCVVDVASVHRQLSETCPRQTDLDNDMVVREYNRRRGIRSA